MPQVSSSLTFYETMTRLCGSPVQLPASALQDPSFTATTILLQVQVAKDSVKAVRVLRGSNRPQIDQAVLQAVSAWRCKELGEWSSDESQWVNLPYTVSRPGYVPVQPRFSQLWAGTYTPSPHLAAAQDGYLKDGQEGSKLLLEGTTVHAKLKTSFGVAFKFESPDLAYHEVLYRIIWKLPAPGIVNPRTGKLVTTDESIRFGEVNLFCLAGWRLDEEWELVGGDYTVEVWADGKRVVNETFHVVVDGAAK